MSGASDTESAFALRRWGTRFVDPTVEERYHAYRIEAATTSVRVAFFMVIFVGVCGTGANLYVHRTEQLVNFFAGSPAGLLMGAAVLMTYKPHLRRRWLFLLVAAGMSWSTVASTVYMNWAFLHDPVPVSMHAIFGWVAMFTFVGFAALRLPPLHAACAMAPPNVLGGVLYLEHVRAGRTGPGVDVVVFFLVFGVGLAINVLMDTTFRRLFRQERIIDAQKEVIAKNEALLQQELGHQVAERSRELGALLARSDGPAGALDLSAGARFDARYKIVRPLGEGGMGAVYEVRRVTDGQSLALKVITSGVTRAGAVRFTREAEIGARLRHAHLVPIVDVGVATNGAPFLVMELVKGSSLEERRAEFGKPAWAIPILRQIAEGLAALHAAGIVHRDLKPANILLSGDAEAPLVRISDFGISRVDDIVDAHAATAAASSRQALTGTGAMLGTPLYMAPEMARKGRSADRAVDIFALGIVAYETLTGRPPFAMPPVILAMADHPLPTPERIDGITPALCDVVMSCLHAEPASRPSIAAVLAALAVPQ